MREGFDLINFKRIPLFTVLGTHRNSLKHLFLNLENVSCVKDIKKYLFDKQS